MNEKASTRRYVLVFGITLVTFSVAFLFANFLYTKRVDQVKNIEDNINRNILESEIQYALLSDVSCDDGNNNTALIDELNTLTKRLQYMEDQRGSADPEVISLKKYYSLLQIKDYLLLRERTKQCGQHPLTILYFYSNAGDCPDCKKTGYVLTDMREAYNNLHIYAFDYNLGQGVIETLKSIYRLENKFPVLVIDRKPYYGFKTRQEIEELIPDLARYGNISTTTATSTPRK